METREKLRKNLRRKITVGISELKTQLDTNGPRTFIRAKKIYSWFTQPKKEVSGRLNWQRSQEVKESKSNCLASGSTDMSWD